MKPSKKDKAVTFSYFYCVRPPSRCGKRSRFTHRNLNSFHTDVKQGREDTWFTIHCSSRGGKGGEGKAVVDLDGVEYPGVLGYPMHSFRALNPCGVFWD